MRAAHYAFLILLFTSIAWRLNGQDLNTFSYWPVANPFLNLPPDARGGGMAQVGTATPADAASSYWNAAKLAFIEGQAGAQFTFLPVNRSIFPDQHIMAGSAFVRLAPVLTIGVAHRRFSGGEFTYMNISGLPIGTFNPIEAATELSAGGKISERVAIGATARLIRWNYLLPLSGNEKDNSFGIDAGVLYRGPEHIHSFGKTRFSAGLSVCNLGPVAFENTNFYPAVSPANLRAGISYKTDHKSDKHTIMLAMDIQKLLVPSPPVYAIDSTGSPLPLPGGSFVISDGKDPYRSWVQSIFGSFNDSPDGFKGELREIAIGAGAEYWYNKRLAARVGYFHYRPAGAKWQYISFGAGFRYRFVEANAAYILPVSNQTRPSNTYQFSLNLLLDNIELKTGKKKVSSGN
ncbi:MAG: PorV/PorQ family protein [Bacteroidetes bacterium]|nr:PorV/PorQ family protein [Bacteroidota bacterium]